MSHCYLSVLVIIYRLPCFPPCSEAGNPHTPQNCLHEWTTFHMLCIVSQHEASQSSEGYRSRYRNLTQGDQDEGVYV